MSRVLVLHPLPSGRQLGTASRILARGILGCALPLAAALPAALPARALGPPSAGEPCRASALREDRLSGSGPRGELALASGARVILADLRWPEVEPEASQAAAWIAGLRERPLTLSTYGDEDRWGRARIEALADPVSEDGEPVDLAAHLIGTGLAQVDAGESDRLCRPGLLALESRARAQRLGLWREAPREAGDGPALAALAGRFVVARGRVLHVGERAARTYLDFARRGEPGLTVTVPKRTWRILRERGLTAQALEGRLVQVRGVVEMRRGPTIEVASADLIEPEPPGARSETRAAGPRDEGDEAQGR